MYEYENLRRISYEGGAVFVPVCPDCGRFVKADDTVMVNDWSGLAKQSNATCSKCGRVEMPFEGFFDLDETEHPLHSDDGDSLAESELSNDELDPLFDII